MAERGKLLRTTSAYRSSKLVSPFQGHVRILSHKNRFIEKRKEIIFFEKLKIETVCSVLVFVFEHEMELEIIITG